MTATLNKVATKNWTVPETYLFGPDKAQKNLALEIYQPIAKLGIIAPHGHVNPNLIADPQARFANPTELLVKYDHYLFRLLYSQGIPVEKLGVGQTDYDPRAAWQTFCANFHLFDATPSGMWLRLELTRLFGVTQKPNAQNARAIYDQINNLLQTPEFTPRALYRKFGIDLLATTDPADADLKAHELAQADGFNMVPTFRPDSVLQMDRPGWKQNLEKLEKVSGKSIGTYAELLDVLKQRREYFKSHGAKATDHGAGSANLHPLSDWEAEKFFDHALQGKLTREEATRLGGHALFDQARLSAEEDGLVMQLHLGVTRNHNPELFARYGPDMGSDIPHRVNWTAGLAPLMAEFGNHPNFHAILFTLDESTYTRKLAPLAGHYPSLRLGPPWWFNDSVKGIERYLDQVTETATLHNTAGFNDDTRAFPSIPARHEVWRRTVSNWLATQVMQDILDLDEAQYLARLAARDLVIRAYRLDLK